MKEYLKDGDAVVHEDRANPRHIVHEKALIMTVGEALHALCKVLDLSLGGCRLLLEERFPLERDCRVEVKFTLRGLPLRFCGTVRWWNREHQVGIQFAAMTERRREMLAEAILDLRAARAAMKEKGESVDRIPNCEGEDQWARNGSGSARNSL
ncbi:MAG TPA: PilZ domain-containing protein [Terracidiphilus sp.]|nr:PilZ domain-containing protein [Terracidiphilus sp.]